MSKVKHAPCRHAKVKAYANYLLTGPVGFSNLIADSVTDHVDDHYFGNEHIAAWVWNIQSLRSSTTRFFPNAGLITISEKEVFSINCDNSPHNGSVPLAFTANHLGCVKLIFGVDPDPENPEGDGTPENSASITICVTDPKIAVDANRWRHRSHRRLRQNRRGKTVSFWLNDDDDTELIDDPDGQPSPLEVDTVQSSKKDYNGHAIVSKRNLEDFARLWIYLDGMQNALVTGEIKAVLKWKTVDSGLPAIYIYASKDGDGSLSYITDDDDVPT